MNIYDDYAEYMDEMRPMIEKLKDSSSSLLVVLEDVIVVCDYVIELYQSEEAIDDDLVDLFESGFGYLANVLGDIKLYFEEYFNKDIVLLNSYSSLILYNIYIDDFKYHLDVVELLTPERRQVIDDIEDEIDLILANQRTFKEELIEKYDQLVIDITPHRDDFQPVYAVFSQVVEELKLY